MNGLRVSLVPYVNLSIKTGRGYKFVQRIKGNGQDPVLLTCELVPLLSIPKGVFVGNLVVRANEHGLFEKNLMNRPAESMGVPDFLPSSILKEQEVYHHLWSRYVSRPGERQLR